MENAYWKKGKEVKNSESEYECKCTRIWLDAITRYIMI
jgi:hypothetical protein